MAKAKPITGLKATAPTAENARIIVRTRLDELYSWSEYVDNQYNVHELHDMRIAAKRLRYSLEIFQKYLPQGCEHWLQEVVQVQEELGALHDSDVMIALLRLCLGSQDSGEGYELALSHVLQTGGKVSLDADLVAHLVDPASAPTAEQRLGLEQMLVHLQQRRKEEYDAFRRHWYELKKENFRGEILQLVDA